MASRVNNVPVCLGLRTFQEAEHLVLKLTKAIIFGLKDSATITVQFEHCKDSSMDEMC